MQSNTQPFEAVDAAQIIADFPSWDLPGDLDNWFLVLDTIAQAQTPKLRVTAAIIRAHLMRAVSELRTLERQQADPICPVLDQVAS